MRRVVLLLACCGLGVALTPRAEAQDVRPLVDRLDRMERDMNMLQRQVYRGTSSSGAPVAINPPDASSALNTELRMSQIEDQMRTLRGQFEEVNYNIDQLKRRLDRLASDLDVRFNQLGPVAGGAGNALPGGEPPPQASQVNQAGPPSKSLAANAPPVLRPPGAGANPAEPASRSGILGTLSNSDAAPEQEAAAPANAPPPASSGTLPTGSAQEQYNYAFGQLRRADYVGAERSFHTFLQRFPNDQLAGNAQYWLGESYYVRGDYTNAAVSFAEGYKNYPKSGKAADNLLKLGMALGNLSQKQDACRAFARLDHDFPTAPSNIKDRAQSEKQRLGC